MKGYTVLESLWVEVTCTRHPGSRQSSAFRNIKPALSTPTRFTPYTLLLLLPESYSHLHHDFSSRKPVRRVV